MQLTKHAHKMEDSHPRVEPGIYWLTNNATFGRSSRFWPYEAMRTLCLEYVVLDHTLEWVRVVRNT